MDDATQLFGRRFEVMATGAEVLVWSGDQQRAASMFDVVEQELHRLSERLTRFDPGSDLERLNDDGGGELDDELLDVLTAALAAWHDTDGRFDVALGAELVAAGYDRTFGELDAVDARSLWVAESDAAELDPVVGPGPAAPPFSIDGRQLLVPAGRRIDLGGFAKGWAADRMRDLIAQVGPCLVNIGGDIAISPAEGVEPWTIGLEVDGATASYDVWHGGVATSGQDVRAWRARHDDDGYAHHIIDPRTGKPAASDVLRVSVFAESCARAEAWTKALLISGFDDAVAEAEQRGITAIIIAMDGTTVRTGTVAQM